MLVTDFYFIWWLLKEPFVWGDADMLHTASSSSELELIQDKSMFSVN